MKTQLKIKPFNLALALAFCSTALLVSPAANAARGTIYNETVGDNVEVNATADAHPNLVGHAFGVYIQQDQHTVIGNGLTINVYGQAGDGLRSNPSGMTNWQQAKGSIRIGDGATINTYGVSADGINANGSTKIYFGDDATITTFYTGALQYANGSTADGAHAVRANFHAEIEIGDRLTAITKGQASYAVYAAQGLGFPGATEGAKITIGDSLTARTEGTNSHGVYAASSKGVIDIGDDADVLTQGNGAHASYVSSTNASIEFGDRAILATEGTSAHAAYISASNGKYELGHSASLTTDNTGSHAIYATGATSVVTTKDDAELLTKGDGSNAIHVTARTGTVTLGDRATLETRGDNAYGVYIYNYRNSSGTSYGDSTVTLGNGSEIKTAGDNAHGVYMYGHNGIVNLGTSTKVSTTGDAAHALYGHGSGTSSVYGENGKINAASGINLKTTGTGSHAAFVDWATSGIDFNGDATISATGTNSFAVYANAGTIQSTTAGVFTVTGNMQSDATGTIDLKMANGSRFKGGTAVSAAGGILNLNIDGASSLWEVTQDSDLTSLVLTNGAQIKLGDHSVRLDGTGIHGVTLTVQDLSGSGQFNLRTRIDGPGCGTYNLTDLLRVTGTSSGSHTVSVNDSNTGGATVDGSERLKIIETADGVATFALTSGVDIGAFVYGLDRGDTTQLEDINHWYLSGTPGGTTPPGPGPGPGTNPGPGSSNPPLTNAANASANILHINYLLNYVENQTLLQRLGELRRADASAQAWVRAYGGKLDSFDGQGLSGFDMDYSGVQFGADRYFSYNDAQIYVGAMAGMTDASPSYQKGDGDNTSYHIGLYGTYKTASGFYVDAIAKYMQVDNSYNTTTSGGYLVKGDGDTRGYAIGVEIGKRFYFTSGTESGFYVEPQLQLTYSHQNSATIKSSNGLKTKLDSYDSTIGRAGVIFGYSVADGDTPVDVYFKTEALSEFNGKTSYTFNDTVRGEYDFKGTWWNNAIGVNTQFKKNHNVYADMNYATGGKFDQMQLNVGYRYTF